MGNQKGMTLMAMLVFAVAIIAVGITAMRVVPVYMQYYIVKDAVKGLNNAPPQEFGDDMAGNAEVLKSNLLKRLSVNSLDEKMFTEMKFEPVDARNYHVIVKYKVIRPLIANVSLLFDFDINQEVKIGSH